MVERMVERRSVFPVRVELNCSIALTGIESQGQGSSRPFKTAVVGIPRFSLSLQTWIRVRLTLHPIYSQTRPHQGTSMTQVGVISMIPHFNILNFRI